MSKVSSEHPKVPSMCQRSRNYGCSCHAPGKNLQTTAYFTHINTISQIRIYNKFFEKTNKSILYIFFICECYRPIGRTGEYRTQLLPIYVWGPIGFNNLLFLVLLHTCNNAFGTNIFILKRQYILQLTMLTNLRNTLRNLN